MLYLQIEGLLYKQMLRKVKKLVAVLATSTSMTEKTMEKELEQVPYIWYFVIFKDHTEAMFD